MLAVAVLASAGCGVVSFQCLDNSCTTAPPSPPLEDVINQYYPLFTAYTQALRSRGLVYGDGGVVFEVSDGCVLTFDGYAGYEARATLDLSGQPSIDDLENAGTDIFEPFGVSPWLAENYPDPYGLFTVSWSRLDDDSGGGVYVSATVTTGRGTELNWVSGCHMSNRVWATYRPLDPVTLQPLGSAAPSPSAPPT
ncbi:MAG: hypothetical protein FWF36_07865 [Propionibacteriaceae bacterium]|nr:hypothetical protein [Propionibacteriaceae bacterium]